MKYLFKALAIFSALVLLLCTVGCKKSYGSAVVYYELSEHPATLDPQTASTDAELSIVKNIFEGLLRKNSSGAIVCGIASEFSHDGLKYTFSLRKSAKWNNGDPVTAEDFVFGLRRALLPETEAPFAARLFAIKNAEDIYNGKKTAETLGVTAIDAATLVIELEYEDESFEETLTTSVAMPCSEEFFKQSGGKYGLTADTVLSCGSYRLGRWTSTDDSFGIRLYRFEDYGGSFEAKNSAVYITKVDDEAAIDRLTENHADIAFIPAYLSDEAEKRELNTVSIQNICWVMTLGNGLSENMRTAFASLTDKRVFSDALPNGYTAADSLFPSVFETGALNDGITGYDKAAAKRLFTAELNLLPDASLSADTKLYYYDDGSIKDVITDLVGHWQNTLGAFINIETVSSAEKLVSELTEHELAFSVFPVRADSADLYEYAEKFGLSARGKSASEIQSALLSDRHLIPLVFQNTVIAYSDALTEVSAANGDGYIDFSFIIKTE